MRHYHKLPFLNKTHNLNSIKKGTKQTIKINSLRNITNNKKYVRNLNKRKPINKSDLRILLPLFHQEIQLIILESLSSINIFTIYAKNVGAVGATPQYHKNK